MSRFILDESADLPLRGHLRARGYDVTAIAHGYPAALADEDVLVIAVAEDRILITNDRDFGELVFRRRLIEVSSSSVSETSLCRSRSPGSTMFWRRIQIGSGNSWW